MYTQKKSENRAARRRSQRIHDQLKTDKRLQLTLAIAAAVASNLKKTRKKKTNVYSILVGIYSIPCKHIRSFLCGDGEKPTKALQCNSSYRDICSRVFVFEFKILFFFLNHFRIWKEIPVYCVPCTCILYTDDCTRASNIY